MSDKPTTAVQAAAREIARRIVVAWSSAHAGSLRVHLSTLVEAIVTALESRPRVYFCACGAACNAEEYIDHLFRQGHDRGEKPSAAAVQDPTDEQDEVEQLPRYHGELWVDTDGTANFKWHIEGGDFPQAREALVKFIECLQQRLTNEKKCPMRRVNKCSCCGKDFLYSYEVDICPTCFSARNEATRSLKERMIEVVKDYESMDCMEFDRKYNVTDKQGLVDALEALPEHQPTIDVEKLISPVHEEGEN